MIALWIPDAEPEARQPLFWRTPDGWVLRLAYRFWLVKSS